MKARYRKKQSSHSFVIPAAAAGVLIAIVLIISTVFHIRHVTVTGNSHYTSDEIQALVMKDAYTENSLLLYLKYNFLSPDTIPFVDKVEISFLSPSSVKIRVYEKSIIGYVSYMGSNIYFDKDGVVVEISSEARSDVQKITGLNFTKVVLNQKLDVEDTSVYSSILNLTQLLEKDSLSPDSIRIKKDKSIVLTFDRVRVNLGTGNNLDEKLSRLDTFLPELEGKSGTLEMENYTEDTKTVSFKQDEE